jgi:hypothetical protein
MADKGFVTRNVALQVAISKFQNTGGEYGVALAILNAAYGRGGDGHAAIAGADASRRGAGRHRLADQVGSVLPAPRHARRGAAAMESVQPALAKSLFDSILLPDGRRLGEVRWSECPLLAARYQRLTRILLACRNFAVPPDATMTLAEIVPEQELEHIVGAVERLNALD